MTNTQLARKLVGLFSKHGFTLATAESCTGGLIAKLVTDISGSSQVLCGGCVTYTNEAKMNVLHIPSDIIKTDTEVSHACAKAMAENTKQIFGSTFGISTTGFAGPTGGTEQDPVGTVYIGLSTPNGTFSERFSAPAGSTRTQVRNAAAKRALELLLEACE
jgi:PncC family amidohydrolase